MADEIIACEMIFLAADDVKAPAEVFNFMVYAPQTSGNIALSIQNYRVPTIESGSHPGHLQADTSWLS